MKIIGNGLLHHTYTIYIVAFKTFSFLFLHDSHQTSCCYIYTIFIMHKLTHIPLIACVVRMSWVKWHEHAIATSYFFISSFICALSVNKKKRERKRKEVIEWDWNWNCYHDDVWRSFLLFSRILCSSSCKHLSSSFFLFNSSKRVK